MQKILGKKKFQKKVGQNDKLLQNGLFEEEPGCSQPDKGVVTNTVKFYLDFAQIFNLMPVLNK